MFVHRLKLRPPQLQPTWIERPSVERKFHAGIGVLAVVAGPGYGKTVLATRLHERWEGPRFWYGLDPGDADLAVFAAHLAEMLRAQGRPLAFVGDSWRLGSPGEIGSQFAEVLADVRPAPLLVFDDVHVLEGSRALQALGEFIARGTRAGAAFVLCGRSMPVALHSVAASARLATVTATDLAFDETESLGYLERVAGERVAADRLERLARRVEGWPAGLALVASTAASQRDEREPELFGARDDEARRLLFEYLATEVLGTLGEDERDFLLRTSILDALEVELCEAVTEGGRAREMLGSLAHRGLFVTRRSDDAFSCHHLFREFLRHSLSRTLPAAEIAQLHALAATVAARRGDAAGEIEHLLDAGDLDGAARALEQSALALLSSGLVSRVHAFLQRVGAERVEASPTLLLARGRVQHQRGDWDRALGSFERSIAVARSEGLVDVLAEAVRLSSPILASRGEFERLMGLLGTTLAEPGLSEASVTSLSTTLGAVFLDTERFDEALAVFNKITPAVVARGDLALQGLVLHNTAVAHVRRGDPYAALAMYERALKLKRSAGQRVSALLTTANLVYVHRVLGDLDEAERLTQQLLEDAEDVGNATIMSHACENEAGIRFARGDVVGAAKGYREALRRCDPGDVFVMPDILHGMAQCALALGDFAEADELCVKAAATLRAARRRQALAAVLVTRAEAAFGRGDAADAFTLAGEALAAARDGEDAALRAGAGLDAAALLALVAASGIDEADAVAQTAAADAIGLLHQRDYRFLLRTKARAFAALRDHMRRWEIGVALIPEAAPAAALRVELLGGLRVFLGEEPLKVDAWKRRKARDIFAYLISLRGRPVSRARLIDTYWPDADADAAHDNLRVTISAIRKAVGDVVKFEANGYRFAAPPRTVVDTELFDDHVDAARQAAAAGDVPGARRRYLAATELYRGEFLEGMDDGGWQWRERERLRAACLEGLRFLVKDPGLDSNAHSGALDRILEVAPFDLDAVRMRLQGLVDEARVAEARREHEDWTARYLQAVGAEPPDVWPANARSPGATQTPSSRRKAP